MGDKLEVTTTTLEMRDRPVLHYTKPHRAGMLLQLSEIPVTFYRYLYNLVGEPYLWWERRAWSDDFLAAVLANEAVEVFVLYMGGAPAAFFELDRRVDAEVELAHIGVLPDFADRGLDRHLLVSAVEAAWDHDPSRVWVTTTNHDHPRRLLAYQWAGFTPSDQRTELIEDPRTQPFWA